MTLINLIRHNITPAIASLGSAAFGTLTTDIVLQRLAWTLAIIVSAMTIIRYLYRAYKWWKEWKIDLTQDEEDD